MQSLYLIKCQKYCKIGVTNDVQGRLAQLATGNPFAMEVLASYRFKNPSYIESALHQKFENKHLRGEWFELSSEDFIAIKNICLLLGGVSEILSDSDISEDEIKNADEMLETVFDDEAKWDFRAMFADGWRIETFRGRRNGKETGYTYWMWRKSENCNRKSLYGGRADDLPYPADEMRRRFEK